MKKTVLRIKCIVLICAMVVCSLPWLKLYADDTFTSNYIQREMSEDQGFESGEANCLCQSGSGYIWIGTDSGLYRYDGSEFVLYTMDPKVDGSTYKINALLYTSSGDIYVGTEGSGLFLYKDGSFTRVSEMYNLGVTTVRAMCMDSDGCLYVGTTAGVYRLAEDGASRIEDSRLMGDDINAIAAYDKDVYAIANNDTFVTIKDNEVTYYEKKTEDIISDLNSIYISGNGTRYYGTLGHSIVKIYGNGSTDVISTGNLSGINKMIYDGTKIWVLADNGVAYIGTDGRINLVSGLDMNESMSDMLVDFEGNYWFTSYRRGLTYLERSKFTSLNNIYGLTSIVNCVTEFDGCLYIGTDDGLVIVDKDGRIIADNELVNMLDGISIRDLYVDSKDTLWICTYRVYGVVHLINNESYAYFNRNVSDLISNSVKCITELNDGSMAIGTENGISILRDNKIVKNFKRDDNLGNSNITAIYQDEDGLIYVGTDGSGLFTIDGNNRVTPVGISDNLDAKIISSITKGASGIWIGTDNGLYYKEGVIRQISAVDSTNSISDIIIDKDGYMWIYSSRGLLKYYESDLLSSSNPEYSLYNRNDGIISSITESSFNYVSDAGLVYVCCDEGLCYLDTNSIYVNQNAPKVRISSISVDGKEYNIPDIAGNISVPGNAQRITIKFSVLTYVNRSDVEVKCYLKGFDSEERVLKGTDPLEVEYTNLEGGTYEFILSAYNSDGEECEQVVSFGINKKLKFWETDWSRLIVAVILVLAIICIFLLVRLFLKILKSKTREVEELSKKSAAAMKSNEVKNEYVNYLSNEIRAPLNSIIALSEMLIRNNENGDSETLSQLENVYKSSHAIQGIVDGITRLSGIKDGTIDLDEKEYAVSDVIYDLSGQFKQMVNRDQVELRVSIEDDIPNGLYGDVDKVKELVTNVFQRAASTTREGYISINIDWKKVDRSSLYDEDSTQEYEDIYLDFTISDTGMGIKEERLDYAFQLDDSYDREDIGRFDLSVGMAIAKELVELMDGEINVQSEYGVSTTIHFYIKQEVFDHRPVNYNKRKRREREQKNSKLRIWLPDVKVLVVDDSEVNLQVEKSLLETYGLQADAVSTGFEAIDKIMMNDYDMVFLDTVMPVMDGMDTVREIRSLDGQEYKKLIIIAMSENIIDGGREDFIISGYSDVLEKPLEVDIIERLFRKYINKDKIKKKANDVKQYIEVNDYEQYLGMLEQNINVEGALKIMGGNIDVFNNYVENYYNEYVNYVDHLGECLDGDVRHFRGLLHDIKSSSANIGAYNIEQKAFNIESAINIGNLQYARLHIHELVSPMKELLVNINNYLVKIKGEQEKTERIHLEEIPKEMLKDMKRFLSAGDVDNGLKVLENIEAYDYGEDDREFLEALKMTLQSMDYPGVADIIDQYLNSK